MPCLDGRTFEPTENPLTIKMRKELDVVTRVACDLETALCELYEDNASTTVLDPLDRVWRENYISTETHNWVRAHRKSDEERIAALKESAMAKLTDEEKEALGL